MTYGMQTVYAKDLEVGHKIVQRDHPSMYVWKLVWPQSRNGYIFAWVSKTQAIPYMWDDLLVVEV